MVRYLNLVNACRMIARSAIQALSKFSRPPYISTVYAGKRVFKALLAVLM
jgi:hypothetical protein